MFNTYEEAVAGFKEKEQEFKAVASDPEFVELSAKLTFFMLILDSLPLYKIESEFIETKIRTRLVQGIADTKSDILSLVNELI